MTPLAGFFKKILGGGSTPAPVPTEVRAPRARPTSDDSRNAPVDDEERSGARRRGSRGGRGRGSSSATVDARDTQSEPTAQSNGSRTEQRPSTSSRGGRRGASTTSSAPASTDARSYSWNGRPGGDSNETEEQARQRREQASRQRRGRTPSFRPYRENLDPPLPEDIAFRSGPEGGDRTILPARRRRGTGLRDTERVMVGGARSLSGWSRPVGEPMTPGFIESAPDGSRTDSRSGTPRRAATPRPVDPDAVLDDDDLENADGVIEGGEGLELDEDGAPRRRRRGRRGGRGRRRPTTGLDGMEATDGEPIVSPEDVPAAIAAGLLDIDDDEDDLDDEDDEIAAELDLDEDDEDDDLDDLGEANPKLAAIAALVEDEEPDDLDEPEDELDLLDEDVADDDIEAEPIAAAPAVRTARRPARAVRADVDPSELPQAFADLGVGERTLQALARYGFTVPTPIQIRAIPALIAGRDVVGVAQTGSGKTIAFGIPMVEALDPELAEVQGLVLVPTRELASQVLDVLKDLAAGFGLEAVGILGGHSLAGDFKALERRPAIVVGTPGRVIDHLQRGTLGLRSVRYAVLDEADQMLDIGFLPDIRRILSRTPKRRQTALFSATMPSTIRRLIWQFMEDPETVTVDPELSTVDTIDQVFFEVATRDKAKGLRELVESELKGRTLVFCKMKRGVDRLEADLARQGVRVGALHGDMDQRRRERVVQEFRNGELDVLIATNVAARGLDIPEITHVVNYDVPQNPEEYVHRIGRTGRAGREGKAITFVSEWDMREWDAIEQAFGDHLRREQLAIYS